VDVIADVVTIADAVADVTAIPLTPPASALVPPAFRYQLTGVRVGWTSPGVSVV
jgi:hypothetical protein